MSQDQENISGEPTSPHTPGSNGAPQEQAAQTGKIEWSERSAAPTRAPVGPATIGIAAVNVAAFIALLAIGGVSNIMEPTIDTLRAWGANYGPQTTDGQWWRLLTCTFLHIGVIHLLMNMWVLVDFGPVAERAFGSFRYLVIYILAGLGGSVSSMAWSPTITSAGASGAVFGVFGAMLAYATIHKGGPLKAEMAQRQRSILMFLLYNVVYGLTRGQVDNSAHFGGLAFGALSGLALMPSPEGSKKSGRAVAGTLGVVAALCAMGYYATLRVGNDPAASYNAYVRTLHPLLEAQDAEVDELNKALNTLIISAHPTSTPLAAIAVRADNERKQIEAIPIKDTDIADMNRLWIARSDCIGKAARELEKQINRRALGEKPDFAEITKQFKEMKIAFDSFTAKKTAFFEKHGLKSK